MTVNVDVGWKCSKCGEYNCSHGVLKVSFSSTTSNLTRRRVEKAKAELEETTNRRWKDAALGIIRDPVYNAKKLRESLLLSNNGKCKNCKKREIWAKTSRWYVGLAYICMPLAFFTLGGLIGCTTWEESIPLIIALGIEIACAVAGNYYDYTFQKRLSRIPRESLPKIVCNNADLVDYAREHEAIKPMNEALYYIMKAGDFK
ncbi:hypothetical protein [Pseudobutyrivibrio sp. YE44]|uniref:hypothetical protein n=1 Tax=Pseudobutyrivibrio sp. YE44 TaxID=1520802 RepID=UPI001160089E|nr:hypothetical protein [Pseudobutyrivibrio sp. YE44]